MAADIQAKAQNKAAEYGRWIEYLARAGYAARAVVYGLVAIIALMAATGGGDTAGSREALVSLMDEPEKIPVAGKGVWVTDMEGQRYIDGLAGLRRY